MYANHHPQAPTSKAGKNIAASLPPQRGVYVQMEHLTFTFLNYNMLSQQ
jgi:hypothetical protein